MSNPEPNNASAFMDTHADDPDLLYANDVRILAEPGGLQLTFTRPRARNGTSGPASRDHEPEAEVIARVVLPSVVARRLLRLLPQRLDLHQALAEEYDRVTDAEVERDPFLAALDAAEDDDEPYTDEQRAAARAGREALQRGEFITLDDLRREILVEDDASAISSS